jgi:hypothetical protein
MSVIPYPCRKTPHSNGKERKQQTQPKKGPPAEIPIPAHFTDCELADGLLRMSIVDYPGGRDELIKRTAAENA